ncbi:MAG TPA: DUF6441 family protein [Burkholderiales bacterium]|nr:DUF6441 family protein [Burkholderiales bacterium]
MGSPISVNMRAQIAELQARIAVRKDKMQRFVKEGMREAKPVVRAILQDEQGKRFNVKQTRFLRTWRIGVRSPHTMIVENIMKGFGLFATGGTIGPRRGRALLIPINTAAGTRLGVKKFYQLIDWLHQEKLLVAKNGILYVKPPMNTSRRGGIGIGTRVQKKFRQRFSGSDRRPTGFDIVLNSEGLTPIAVIRRSITQKKRWDMDTIVRGRIIPVILQAIEAKAKAG